VRLEHEDVVAVVVVAVRKGHLLEVVDTLGRCMEWWLLEEFLEALAANCR
jgi:hypothetical protein